jgi:hypothetical protein
MRLMAAFLLVMTIPYARQALASPTVGQDFRVFFAAATVVAEHGNPYDWPSLAAVEYRLYDAPQQLKPGDRQFYEFLAYPEGPWLAFALSPLAELPWQVADLIYGGLLLLVMLAASFLTFRLTGWSQRRALIAAGLTALSAIGFINLFMGQVSVLVFGAFIGAWWFASRGNGWAAGLLLTVIWLKPNIGLPLPLIVTLLATPLVRKRLILGFIGGSAIAFGMAAAILRDAFLDWPRQIPRMWQAVQGLQPDMASVESFFYPGLHGWAKTVVLMITLLAAAAYAAWAMTRVKDWRARSLTLLLVWLGALPFVQSYDLILVLPLLALLLGPELRGWANPLVEVTLWAFLTVPLFYFLGFRIGYFNGFSAIAIALLLLAWHRSAIVAKGETGSATSLQGVAA